MFHISTHRTHLDDLWVIESLRSAYWGAWLTAPQILRSIDNSLCFGAYETATQRQIGFARVVTDRAVTSTLNDVIVRPEFRGRGVGRALVQAVVTHEWVAPTICILASRDAKGLYRKFGFVEEGGDVMKRGPV